jgi:hypothetical protein
MGLKNVVENVYPQSLDFSNGSGIINQLFGFLGGTSLGLLIRC